MTGRTVPDAFAEAIARHAARVAYSIYDERGPEHEDTWSYERLSSEVERRHAALPPGRGPIAILLDNCPEWVATFFAACANARPVVLADSRLDVRDLIPQLRHASPDAIVTDPDRAGELAALWSGTEGESRPPLLLNATDLSTWPGGADLTRAPEPLSPAAILYTSGSTGTPKGVVLSHHGMVMSGLRGVENVSLTPRDVALALVPFSHVAGVTSGLLTPLFAGTKIVFLRTLRPNKIMAALKGRGSTILFGPPALYELIVRRILEKIDAMPGIERRVALGLLAMSARLTSLAPAAGARIARSVFHKVHEELAPTLDILLSGGAPLRPAVARTLIALGFDVRDGYGLSENSGVIAVARTKYSGRPGTVGPPMPSLELRIELPDESGAGEIRVRGDQVMLGYHNAPQATAAALQDGWLRTGDMGRLRSDGYLEVCGRATEVIVTSSGKKIYPEDIEFHFAGTPGVGELCAFALATDAGHLIALAAVPPPEAPDRESAVKALREHLERRNLDLAPHRRVQRFFVRSEELPKTTTRKVQRHRLIAELAALV
jgi:long-chain acyl-CoA synthetase